MILCSILIATIGDFVAFKYYPQGGSRVYWTYSQVKGNLMKLQNITHKLADMFCNNPEECKNVTDEFFAIAADIPQDFVLKIVELLNTFAPKSKETKDDGIVKRNYNEAKKAAVDYSSEVQLKGDAEKAEMVIKSLKFSSYDENNLCDLMEGIPPEEYDVTVDEIADLTNMPEKLKKVIKRAKNFTGGKVQAVNRLQFKTKDGNMVFGRVAVFRRGEVLDMAYSLHSVEYKLAPKQRKPENAEKLNKFSESLGNDGDNGETLEEISLELREDFLAFFHKQAIQGFVKHCDYVLKTLKDEGKDGEGAPEVLKNIGVRSDEAAVGDDKTEN